MIAPFSIGYALGGGLLIGGAASLLLLLTGRIAGISGLVGTALVARFVRQPHIEVTSSVPLLIAGGLLVGFGTRLGSGCTSGHGVCGIGRLSPRSIVATLTFMVAGFATVFITRHMLVGG